jgi:hypothetical protein
MRHGNSMVVALVLAVMAAQGCEGCDDERYYCDETGCFWCDSYGCRPVDPPAPASCAHGDWECPPDRPFCTSDGYCVAFCRADEDCPSGLRCLDGVCLPPDVIERPPMRPGSCAADPTVCASGEYCAPSLCCLPSGGDACCADIDCSGGRICDAATHACVAPPEDGGTIPDDGGTPVDAGDTGPIRPEPQCRTNAQCSAHYLCVDGVCKLPCTVDADCGLGCSCVAGFCTGPAA